MLQLISLDSSHFTRPEPPLVPPDIGKNHGQLLFKNALHSCAQYAVLSLQANGSVSTVRVPLQLTKSPFKYL